MMIFHNHTYYPGKKDISQKCHSRKSGANDQRKLRIMRLTKVRMTFMKITTFSKKIMKNDDFAQSYVLPRQD